MKVKWTDAQDSAIRATGRTLLVSAAAGSGKTATLTEKIIRALTSKDNRSSLSRMLIVTFTKASAADVRAKISKALTAAIAENPGDTHLYNQMVLLGSADISTIDAFCMKPIREHFAECKLPASFRIADDAELAPIKERVLSNLIDEFFIKYAGQNDGESIFNVLNGNDFADLFDALSAAKSDAKFTEIMLKLHSDLLNYPEGLEILKNQAANLHHAADTRDIFLCPHGQTVLRLLEEFCDSALPFLTDAVNTLMLDEKGAKFYLPSFAYDLQFVNDISRFLKEKRPYSDFCAMLSAYKAVGLKAYKNAPENIAKLKDSRSVIVSALNEFRDNFFSFGEDEIYADLARTARMCEITYDFLTHYDKSLTEEKRNRGITDFTDNKRMLYSLLYDEAGNLTPLAKEYATKYDIVFIDEYQDVDEIQDKIFAAIGTDHRFMVGDIKQSIYGFRGAEPTVFAGYRRDLPDLDKHGFCKDGNSIFMSENFRCNQPIIKTANAVCSHVFHACPDSIGYTDGDDLRFSKVIKDSNYVQPKVQFDVIFAPDKKKDEESECDTPELERSTLPPEAVNLANRIAELLRGDYRLENGERIKPSDITVLVRKHSAIPDLKSALVAMNIPTEAAELDHAEAGQDLLHSAEMIYLVNLLRVINNPSSDIPLLEILGKTPLNGGFELEEIVNLRNKRLNENADSMQGLYYTVKQYAESGADPTLAAKCRDFVSWLEGLRELSVTHSAEELLRVIKTDKNCYCGSSDAFLYIYEKARTYRQSSFVGLYNFLNYFERHLITETKAVDVSSSDGGRVSIMTVHNSKGLEFPVCFLYNCGGAFSTKSAEKDLIFLRELGISLMLFHRVGKLGEGYKKNTLLRNIAKKAIILRDREAEMQNLYVAMTRAREYMFISASPTKASGALCGFDRGDRFRTLSCNSYAPWLITGLQKDVAAHDYCLIDYIDKDSILPAEPLSADSASLTATDLDDGFVSKYKDLASTASAQNNEEKFLRSLPTKVPASKLKDDMLDNYVFFESSVSSTEDIGLTQDEDAPIGADGSGIDYREKESILESLRLMKSSDVSDFDLLLDRNGKASAAQKGTAAHAFLQFCDFSRFTSSDFDGADLDTRVKEELARLCQLGFIDSESAGLLDITQLSAFFKSKFFKHVVCAHEYRRELRFNRFIPLSSLTKNPAIAAVVGDRTLYVQGSIDLVIHTADEKIILCDYKSDKVSDEERTSHALIAANMKRKHGAQLCQYSKAIFDLYGKYPEKIYIYSLPLGEAVEIDIN